MVLIIKSSGNRSKDIKMIATQMVNIETNQHVYDKSGKSTKPDTKEAKRPAFNVYSHNDVEFDFQVTFGVVVIYAKSDESFPTSIKEEIEELGVPKNFTETIHKNTDYYTLVKTPVSDTSTVIASNTVNNRACFRKIITDHFYVKKTMLSTGAHFAWLVLVKTQSNFRGAYLRIEELDTTELSESYLNKSVCTIVFDELNLFNVPTMTKQLDYPALAQYTMFANKQIVQEPLYISWVGGLHFELYYQFTKRSPQIYPLNQTAAHMLMLSSGVINMGDLKLKRLNPDVPYLTQLNDPFDYDKQEDDEKVLVDEGKPKYLNDVCFITKVPLWDSFYVVTIKNETHEFDIAVSPAAMHCYHTCGKKETMLQTLIAEKNKAAMVKVQTCEHPRSFLEVLDMIDIDPVKKNIMRCMELYGSYSGDGGKGHVTMPNGRMVASSRQYYVVDKNTSQIYVGVASITDCHVAIYQNTKTILFRVINVDATHTPDPIIFRDLQQTDE